MATIIYLENGLNPHTRKIVESTTVATINDVAPKWQTPYIAFLEGKAILRKDWDLVLHESSTLAFIDADAIPQGGGGGTNPLRTILMLAVMVAAPYTSTALLGINGAAAIGAMGVQAVTAGIAMAGMALVNAVAPVPQPPSPQMAAAMAAPSPTYSLQAQGNSARIDAAIPEHFGRSICYPDLASQPYAEFDGNEQYLYQTLCIGRGEYALEALKIEDTLASGFDEVIYTIYPPYTHISEEFSAVSNSLEVSGQEMDTNFIGPFTINSAGSTINKLGLDFIAPAGLFYANDDGSLSSKSVYVEIIAQQINDFGQAIGGEINLSTGVNYSPWSDWVNYYNPALIEYVTETDNEGFTRTLAMQNVPADTDLIQYKKQTDRRFFSDIPSQYRTRTTFNGVMFSAATNTPQRWSKQFTLPAAGRWQVKVRRTDTKDESTRAGHTIVWGGARGYHPQPANKTYGDCTVITVKMRASNNLSMQASRKFNIVATRKLPVWNGSSWTAPIVTRNPIWAFVYICKQVGITDSKLDLPSLKALADTLDARGDYFDGRFDNFLGFWEAVSKTISIVRAKPFMQGGLIRVLRDAPQSIPVAMFTTRNIAKGSLSVDYLMPNEDTADNIDIKYFDSNTWSSQTINTFIAGSPKNTKAKVELFGVTDRNQAYREGIYQCASNRYRRKMVKFQTEMEGFIPSYGDLIIIQHDMPGWGQAGEVIEVSGNILTLSEDLTWFTGNHYIGLRTRYGDVNGPYLVTRGTEDNQVIVEGLDFIPYTGQDAEKTHYAFGAAEAWRQPALVLSVRPINMYTVEIEAVNEDPAVHTADQNSAATPLITTSLANYMNAPVIGAITAKLLPFGKGSTIVSWAPVNWAQSYVIEQSKDRTSWSYMGTSRTTDFTGTALYGKETYIRVAAINLSRGPWSDCLIAQTPRPSNVTTLTALATLTGIELSWVATNDAYFEIYEIRLDGTSWDSAIFVTRTKASSISLPTLEAGTHTWRIKKIDDTGQESILDATAAVTVLVPGTPGVTHQFIGGDEVISWNIPTTTFSVDRYEVRTGSTFALSTLVSTVTTNSLRRKVDYTVNRNYYVVAIDIFGNRSAAGAVAVTIVLPGAPTLPATGSLEYVGGIAVLKWAAPTTGTLAIKEYIVKYGNVWSTAKLVSTLSSTSIEVPIDWQGGRSFLIAAVDMADNVSPFTIITTNILKPVAITGLTDDIVGRMLLLTWNTPVITGGTLPIKSYEIKRGASFDTGTTIAITADTKIQLEIDWNDTATFWVAAVDINNVLGATTSSTISTIAKPSNPLPNVNIQSSECILTWDTPLTVGLPISRYEVKYSNTPGSSWEAATYITEVTGTQVSIPVTWIGTRYFKVTAIDTSNNLSTSVDTPALINYPNAPVFDPNATQVGGALIDQFRLSWVSSIVDSSRLPIDHYVVGYDVIVNGVVVDIITLATISANSYIAKADWTLNRNFWVKAVDINNNESSKSGTVLGISEPGAPTNLSIQVVDNNVLLYWSAPTSTLPVISYEISRNDPGFNKNNAATYIGEKSGGFTTVFETAAGIYTYYIRAINSAGTTGSYSQGTVTVSQPPDYVLNVAWDSTFSQTKVNAAVDSQGSLVMPVNTSETWQQHFTAPNNFGSPQGQITASGGIYQYYAMPALSSGYYEEVFDYGTLLAATKITVTPGAKIINSPVVTCSIETSVNGTTWSPATIAWSIYATAFRYVRVRITVTSTGNDDLYELNTLVVVLDSKLKNDAGTAACVSTDAGGTLVLFSPGVVFVDITSITVTPIGTTPLIAMYDFVDAPNPTGFKVLLFTTAGTRASGTVSWSVKGY